MSTANPAGVLGVTPYLYYPDGEAALEWLSRVFGFREVARYVDAEGVVQEAEMSAGATRIHFAGIAPGPDQGAGQMLIVHVTDIDAHRGRVVAAGVDAPAPEDKPYGQRVYEVGDPWGYRWTFWQDLGTGVRLPDGWREIRAPSVHGSGDREP